MLDIGRKNGNRQQVRKRGFATKKAARNALIDALSDVRHGRHVRPQRLLFGACLDDWLEMLATAGRRATTIAGYRRIVRVHVKPALGTVQIQNLTAIHLDRLYTRLITVGSPDRRGL